MATKNEIKKAEPQKPMSFSDGLKNELTEVQEWLPKDFNIHRFTNNAVALLNENKVLMEFAQKHGVAQIKANMIRGAYLGLDAINSEFYLVPYGSKLSFMTSHKGAVKLAKKYSSRPIKDIQVKLVREGDLFEEQIVNGEPSITFKPKAFNDGKIIGAFAYALFEDGGMKYETMSLADLENTRKSSKMPNGPTWKNHTGEMYKKTVLHRLCKNIDLDFESPKQSEYFIDDDMKVETDVKNIVANEIEENANSEEFVEDEENIIDVEEVPFTDYSEEEECD